MQGCAAALIGQHVPGGDQACQRPFDDLQSGQGGDPGQVGTPLGPVGWTIAGSATVAATAVTALLPVLSRVALPGSPSTAVHLEAAEPSAEPLLVSTAGS